MGTCAPVRGYAPRTAKTRDHGTVSLLLASRHVLIPYGASLPPICDLSQEKSVQIQVLRDTDLGWDSAMRDFGGIRLVDAAVGTFHTPTGPPPPRRPPV